jgi:hypothetical protein
MNHRQGRIPMSIATSIFRSAFGAAALFLVLVPAAEAEELQCADKSVKAWGIGFSPSPEQSTEAAKKEWLAKAVTIYSDAKWETAKAPDMMCVTQGLYSKCAASGVPCGATPAAPPPKQN